MQNPFNVLSVLVIDDAPPILSTIKQMLLKFGVLENNLVTTKSPKAALVHGSIRSFDLIICDYNLGTTLNGKQLFEEFIHYGYLRCDAVFMLISGDRSSSTIRPIIELKPDEYILKPFTSQLLKERSLAALKRKKALAQLYKAERELDPKFGLELCGELLPFHREYYFEIEQFRGSFQSMLAMHHEAKATYESLAKQTKSDWAQLGVANSLANLGDVEQANQIVDHLLDKSPNNTCVRTEAAKVSLINHKIPTAIAHLEVASQLTPGNSERELVIVNLCIAVGEYQQALEHFNAYMEINKNTYRANVFTQINFVRVMLYSYCESFTNAQLLADIKRHIHQLVKNRQEQNRDEIELLLAHYAYASGNFRFAITCLKKLVAESSINHFYAAYQLAWILDRLEMEELFTQAIEDCNTSLKIEYSQLLFTSKITMLNKLCHSNKVKNKRLISQHQRLKTDNIELSEQLAICLEILEQNPLLKHVCIRAVKLLNVAWPMHLGGLQVRRILQKYDHTIRQLFASQDLLNMDYDQHYASALKRCDERT
ncbi:hypothetical protein BIY21_12645 [Vibrio ponticus]|uniref:Response regulatory domain-containing protein n=1 Tax=Vibrio ponticus TaxID=265668 RepID=A0ABX3FFU5_9VIBR|nr:response regulator [Vibrio ponticus]OLQ91858.1 hypothetical protein BIY21_12645 [Vibrio ponticus]